MSIGPLNGEEDLEKLLQRLQAAVELSGRKALRIAECYPGFYPMYSEDGCYRHEGGGASHWWYGFYPGLLWNLFRITGQARYQEVAQAYALPLADRQRDENSHDIGILVWPSFYPWYRTTGDQSARATLIQAGRTMAGRFHEKGGFLAAALPERPETVGYCTSLIDVMMDVGLVFFAARETRDSALFHAANQHCLTSRRTLVRGDGSVANEGLHSAEGEFLRQITLQGYRPWSCWSRALAWSLQGFGIAYRHTRDVRYLETAELNAEYFLEKIPGGGVPPWDFDAPAGASVQVDSGAAAVMASGLFDLAQLSGCRARRERYFSAAMQTILTLLSDEYLVEDDLDFDGILKRGTYNMTKGLGVNEATIWGDCFFVAALGKALRTLLSQR